MPLEELPQGEGDRSVAAWPLVTVVIVAWNNRKDLELCLPSLAAQDYPELEIILVDNASTDGTLPWLREHYPQVRLICNSQNVGLAAGANQGFAAGGGAVLVELNADTTVEANWLFPLVEAMQQEGVGLVNPLILWMSRPGLVNTCGNNISLTGLTFCIGLGEPATQFRDPPFRPVPVISGAAFAMSRACYETTGGFDPDYFMYYEDTDLSLRARLAGFEILAATHSVVYHDYAAGFSPQKMYWIERNRHLTLLKCLRFRTWLILFPAIFLGDILAWGFALLRGPRLFLAKARAAGWILGHLREIQRRRIRVRRVAGDRALIQSMSPYITFQPKAPEPFAAWMSRLLEPVLRGWKQLALHLVKE